jgi:ABC-type phosphate transport system substrate-binding protein
VLAVIAAVLVIMGGGLLAPARPAAAAAHATISGAGSTWSYPAIARWIGSVAPAGLAVNYDPVGSTAGRQQFRQGVVDWAASEVPYGERDGRSLDPPPARGYTYIPATAGGLAFMYNLSIGGRRVTSLRLSGAVIAGIFTGRITRWNDRAVAADNPGLALPAIPVVPVVRSDVSGEGFDFTQWMIATEHSYWTSYCHRVGFSPCTATSAYPVLPHSAMVGEPLDGGVGAYIARPRANGAIGFIAYSSTLPFRYPVAKVLNAAGYYTPPTAGNVGVSLLAARVNNDPASPLYLTADLSGVYTDPDPRAYELSAYSYLIAPTASQAGFTTGKGSSLGAFATFALCRGQREVDALGYSALPVNLVREGYAQLRKVPGANLPATARAFIANCDNPTFAADGTSTLARTDPLPPACDRRGATQCPPATAGGFFTVTTVTASPSPATAGQPVTLRATVTAAMGTTIPPGKVQFEVAGTSIGRPVAIDSSGVATVTTAFATAGTQLLSAVFRPAGALTLNTSTGTVILRVRPSSILIMPLTATIAPGGSFSVTVTTAGTVTLTASGGTATATLIPIVVSDTRNTYPGWSVTGEVAGFTGSGTAAGATIPGNQLGWTPTATALAPGAVLGGTIAPAAPGLGTTAADLASASAGTGVGTSTLSADLTLAIPPSAAAGPYASVLTLTAVASAP